MADGMFNSSSSSSSGGSGVGLLVELPPWMLVPLLVLAVLFLVYQVYETEQERELDRTVYVGTSRNNFDRWQEGRTDEIVEGSLWFEEGSSHRENYHCKGGQFQATTGNTVTFCCSINPNDVPPCVVITP